MKRLVVAAIMLLGCLSVAKAQSNHPNSKEGQAYSRTESLFGKRTIDSLVVKALADNMPNYYNAPGLPTFSVVGRNRKFYLGIGGYAKASLSYDLGNPISSPYFFSPNSIPTNKPKGNNGLIQMGAGTSNISFNFVGLPETKNKIGAYFNFNFDGPDYQLNLLNAYLKYCGFTVGYGLSLFTDVMAGPPTIDFAGPNAWTFTPNTLVDYEYQWGKNWGVGVGLEMPMASYTNSADTYTVNQQIPDVPFYFQYSWNKRSSWVRLSGIVRNMLYRDEAADKTRNSTGWGAKLSGSAGIGTKVTAYYQALYGEGISSYIQDARPAAMDLLPSTHKPGLLDNVEAWGGYFGLQYNFTTHVYASATYSVVRTSAPDATYDLGQYKNAQYVVGNLFWHLAPQVTMGAEYLWGELQTSGGGKKHNSRIQTMIQFNF